jgi:hypothetical protein
MRKRKGSNGLTVNAVAGSYVVVLGLNITDAMRNGLRGFAIQRTDLLKTRPTGCRAPRCSKAWNLIRHPAANIPA